MTADQPEAAMLPAVESVPTLLKTPGQVGYEAYGAARRWLTFMGTPILSWEEADDEIKQAWEAAAIAIADAAFAGRTL